MTIYRFSEKVFHGYSDKNLADGLKRAAEKKTLDKITVKELVATCV